MKTGKIYAAFAALVFTFISLSVMAGPPPPPPNTDGPIDGGVVALLIGAAIYGYIRLKKTEEKAEA
jgi:hypothetical protein